MLDLNLTASEMQAKIGALRSGAGRSPEFLLIKKEVKLFQNIRLEQTYQDLLESKGTHAASRFFLDHLYCTGDLSRRDHQVERVLPKLEKLLPEAAIEVVRKVILMDLLAETLDDDICNYINGLNWTFDANYKEEIYIAAYRAQGQYALRARQIELVSEVGNAIWGLLRFPFLKPLLKMTRGAAQKANLEDFHDFLSHGMNAFTQLDKPTLFFQTIQEREFGLLEQIREGHLKRFNANASQ